MNVGDLVEERYTSNESVPEDFNKLGIVVKIDDTHRQTIVDVLWPAGLEKNIWVNHLEVVSESG
tara:strand:- start:1299 stop:1490 length:192 start_codon:yes stop_codon:yes gene_type:complete